MTTILNNKPSGRIAKVGSVFVSEKFKVGCGVTNDSLITKAGFKLNQHYKFKRS